MIYVTYTIDPRRAGEDLIGVKELLAADAERYGCVLGVEVRADKYEQTRLEGQNKYQRK